MAINPLLNAVSSTLAQQSAAVSVRSANIARNNAAPASQNVSDSQPSQSVLKSASLLNASSNFAQLGSLLEVAQSGTEQIGQIIEQLQALAQQASSGGNTDLATLDGEFQQALDEINQTVDGTTFGGTKLLDGTQSGSADGQTLSLPDLSAQGLFGANTPSISTPQNATAALASLSQAQDTVTSTGAAIDNTFGQLSFASASVDSALANSTAASSTLSEGDWVNGAASQALASFLSQSSAATQAQTGNITENLLSLLQE